MRIEYSDAVLGAIEQEVLQGFRLQRPGGVEVGGVLYGVRDPDKLRITAYRPIPCEHAFGPDFILSRRDLAALALLLDAPKHDPELRGLVPAGWYHSRTRTHIHLSRLDVELFDRYFPQPWQIALVLRPESFGPTRAHTFFREQAEAPVSRTERLPAASPPAMALPATTSASPPAPPRRGRPGLHATLLLAAAVAAWTYFAIPRENRSEIYADGAPEPAFPPVSSEVAPLASVEEPPILIVPELEPPPPPPPAPPAAAPPAPAAAPAKAARTKFVPPRGRAKSAPTPVLPDAPELGRVGLSAALPQVLAPRTPSPPPPPGPKPAAPPRAPAAPKSGVLIWTGRLERNSRLRIDGARVSAGSINGALPGGPVRLRVYPAELTAAGIRVYSSDRQGNTEPPGPRNGWNQTTYVRDPRLAGSLRVVESPSSANGWNRLVLEAAGASMSVVMVEWESF